MSDLVERLRGIAAISENYVHAFWTNRAADEIERLRSDLEFLRDTEAVEIERLQEENKLIERALQNAEAIIERLRERDVK